MDAFPWAGSEVLWAQMAQSALGRKHHVLLSLKHWATTPEPVRQLVNQGAELHCRNYSKRSLVNRIQQRVFSNGSSSMKRTVEEFAPDVVCICQGGAYDMVRHPTLLRNLRGWGRPFVVIVQCNQEFLAAPEKQRHAQEVFCGAERVVFVSRRNLDQAQRHLATELTNAVVVQNPMKLSGGPPPWPRIEPISLASVARLEVYAKGQDVLFEVLSDLVWQQREWRLNLYGTGKDRDYLERLARYYAIDNRVTFHGQVSDIRQVWAENHIQLMPSRMEGTPLSLLEAMACGRPAVVSDVGGNIEWVGDGVEGFIADAPTVRSFGAAMERAWHQRQHWETMGRNAGDRLAKNRDPAPGETLLEILVQAVENCHKLG